MDIKTCILDRRSIRKFKDVDISDEILRNLLGMAIKAPSGKNRQPWKFFVIKNEKKEELVEAMVKVKKVLQENNKDVGSMEISIQAMKSAPVVIIIYNRYAKKENDYNYYRMLTDVQSVGAAIQNINLAALDYGLGTLWICDVFYAEKEVGRLIDSEDQLIAALAIGIPDQNPNSRSREDLSVVSEWFV